MSIVTEQKGTITFTNEDNTIIQLGQNGVVFVIDGWQPFNWVIQRTNGYSFLKDSPTKPFPNDLMFWKLSTH